MSVRAVVVRLRAFSPRWRAVAAAGLVAVVSAAVWLAWPSRAPKHETRARQYAHFTQCLLTDAAGVNSPAAQPVWAGMQQSSVKTAAKSQFLAIPAAAARYDAETYVNTLVARGCDVILAAGPVPVRVATEAAASSPARHFILVGDGPSAGNTIVVRSAKPSAAAVANVLTDAFHGRFTPGTVGG